MALNKTLNLYMRNFLANIQATGFSFGPSLGERDQQGLLALLVNYVGQQDTQMVWDAATDAPAGGARTSTRTLSIENAQNALNFFAQGDTAVITLTGTATGKLINGLASPQTLTLVDGQATAVLTGTSTGTIIATITSVSRAGLTHSSVCTVTLS